MEYRGKGFNSRSGTEKTTGLRTTVTRTSVYGSADPHKLCRSLHHESGANQRACRLRMTSHHLFVSYARIDAPMVMPLVSAVREEYERRALDVDVWVDLDNLTPGQNWDAEITRVLRDCIGLLVFVSPASMQSDWVKREITAAADMMGRLIIPVILQHVPDLPAPLARRIIHMKRFKRALPGRNQPASPLQVGIPCAIPALAASP